MNSLKVYLVFGSLIASVSAFARSASENFSFTPIVGVERIQKFQPTPRMKTRVIFGGQAVYKLPVAALEAEYTHGQDSSYDALTTTTYKDVDDKIKLGLRGGFAMGPYLSSYLRGGAQGKQSQQTRTVDGGTSSKTTLTKVNPYVGTGLSIHLFNAFALSADVTAVYTPSDTAGLSDYEIQPSIGFSISI